MAQWQENGVNYETHLWKLYQNGISYQNKLGLRTTIPTNIDFYEGRQWPQPTEATKNLPRPVVNIVKMICRNKKSSILSSPVKIQYKSYSSHTDIDKLNSFLDFMMKEMNQEGLDKLAIDDGIKKGSYFYHYYWDKNAFSPSGLTEGGVRCEIIDPLNIFFSNPEELDEQKQEWILIATHIEPSKLAELCDKEQNGSLKLFASQFLKNDKNHTTVPLLTRYFRQGGEVWCEKCTQYHIVNKPFRLAPSNERLNFLLNNGFNGYKGVETQHLPAFDGHTESDSASFLDSITQPRTPSAVLYPVVCGYYERREGSIYGISEVEGIIPNQKAINFNIAMSLLNTQQCAWGKYIALPNALNGQKITNSPGQVLIDYSGTGNGIKRMSDEGISSLPLTMSETLTSLTRTFTGATELLSGEALGANMSGVAIAQLQAQAEIPIEELRSTFWEVKKKQGKVLAQFIRLYYYCKEFINRRWDENGHECEFCDYFYSEDYENAIFDVVVEPTRGTKLSISSDINMLNTCLSSGKISLETYIKAYPEGAISNKSTILRQIKEEKTSEIDALKREIEMLKNSKTLDPVSIV